MNDGNAAVADARLRRENSRLVPPSVRWPALLSLAREAAVGCIADIDIADLDGSDVGPVPRDSATDRCSLRRTHANDLELNIKS